MKTLTKTASVLALLIICALSCAAQPAASAQVQQRSVVSNNVQLVIDGKVINVHDGDTITVVDQDNKKTHIRLLGIDAPKLKQAYGVASQQNLSRLVLGKPVTIVWTKLDKYRRTVGTIMLNGRDVNIEQVKAGLAWHFKKYEDEQKPEDRRTYAMAEQAARAARLGLWKDPNPTPPGDYRLGVKTARWGPAPPEGTIIGNKNSKKYHRPDCPGYRDMAKRNRVFFKSVEVAESAGYKRAGNCPAEVQAVVVKPSSRVGTVKPVPIPTNPSSTPVVAAVQLDTKIRLSNGSGARSSQLQIIGNKNSKIYHVPGCSSYNSVSEKNRVFFNSAAEAEQAGFRKAKNCS
jgi:endonuclease YncB( thermonuclease family)